MNSTTLKCKKVFLVTITTVFLCVQAAAQKKMYEAPTEENKFSASSSTNIGGFIGGDGGLGAALAVQYQFKKTFVQVQFSGISELGIFDNDYHDCTDFGLLYGINKRNNKFILTAAAGISLYSYRFHNNIGGGFLSFTNEPAKYVNTSKNVIGFPVNAGIIYQPKKFGVGITTHSNFNAAKSYVSGGLTLRYTF
jgi:hypothetical protein